MSERKQRKHINNHQVTAGEAQPEKCASLFRDIPKCTDTDPSRDRWASISCVVPPSRWQDGERESLSGTAHRVGHYWDEFVFWLVRSQTLSLSLGTMAPTSGHWGCRNTIKSCYLAGHWGRMTELPRSTALYWWCTMRIHQYPPSIERLECAPLELY